MVASMASERGALPGDCFGSTERLPDGFFVRQRFLHCRCVNVNVLFRKSALFGRLALRKSVELAYRDTSAFGTRPSKASCTSPGLTRKAHVHPPQRRRLAERLLVTASYEQPKPPAPSQPAGAGGNQPAGRTRQPNLRGARQRWRVHPAGSPETSQPAGQPAGPPAGTCQPRTSSNQHDGRTHAERLPRLPGNDELRLAQASAKCDAAVASEMLNASRRMAQPPRHGASTRVGRRISCAEAIERSGISDWRLGSKAAPSADQGLSPEGIHGQFDASRNALQMDGALDEYFLHQPDPQHSLEESLQTMDVLVGMNVVREVGLSNFHVDEVKRAFDICDEYGCPSVYQGLYNLSIDWSRTTSPFLRENVRFVAYNGLAAGLLTGKHRQGTRFYLLEGSRTTRTTCRAFILMKISRPSTIRLPAPRPIYPWSRHHVVVESFGAARGRRRAARCVHWPADVCLAPARNSGPARNVRRP